MKNLRLYGDSPYSVAVIHGGPGAPGDLAPLARELSNQWGVLEPLQTKNSLDGQVQELKETLETHCHSPVKLIGHSWGAFLSYILTGKHPNLVQKLILIASGPYESQYAKNLMEVRLARLNKREKNDFISISEKLTNSTIKEQNRLFSQLGKLISKADSYNPIIHGSEVIEFQYEVNQNVWKEASLLRSSGELLEIGKSIKCPVVAIHGDYDPHSAEGVRKPLMKVISDFKFFLLEKCGHYPWYENEAKTQFYKLLISILKY